MGVQGAQVGPAGFIKSGFQFCCRAAYALEPLGKGRLEVVIRSGIAPMGVDEAGEWLEVGGAGAAAGDALAAPCRDALALAASISVALPPTDLPGSPRGRWPPVPSARSPDLSTTSSALRVAFSRLSLELECPSLVPAPL